MYRVEMTFQRVRATVAAAANADFPSPSIIRKHRKPPQDQAFNPRGGAAAVNWRRKSCLFNIQSKTMFVSTKIAVFFIEVPVFFFFTVKIAIYAAGKFLKQAHGIIVGHLRGRPHKRDAGGGSRRYLFWDFKRNQPAGRHFHSPLDCHRKSVTQNQDPFQAAARNRGGRERRFSLAFDYSQTSKITTKQGVNTLKSRFFREKKGVYPSIRIENGWVS